MKRFFRELNFANVAVLLRCCVATSLGNDDKEWGVLDS